MAATVQPDPRTGAIINHLSQPRLAPYVAAAGGNIKDGLRLYQWNIDLSGAVYEALHVFEVVLRNAMDIQLSAWNATQTNAATGRTHDGGWLMDPAHLLVRLAGGDITKAEGRARTALRTGKPGGRVPGHPDVLAQLTFGTWRFLLPSRDPGRQLLMDSSPCPELSRAHGHASSSRPKGRWDLSAAQPSRSPRAAAAIRTRAQRGRSNARRPTGHRPTTEAWFTSRQRVTGTLRARP